MDFIEEALKLEKKTVSLYRDLAERCSTNEGVRRILTMLAEDHEKHLSVFGGIKSKSCSGMSGTGAFKASRHMFEKMQESKNTFSCDLEQLKLYEEARDMVERKHKMYAEAAEKMECREDRDLVQKIAEEERKQLIVLENIIQMVRRPQNWIEDAEFNHLEPY